MAELQARVKSLNADIGLPLMATATESGSLQPRVKTSLPIADDVIGMDVASRNPGEPILYDVKCSRHLGELIRDAGGQPLMWKTGHSLVKRKMKEVNAPLGGNVRPCFLQRKLARL